MGRKRKNYYFTDVTEKAIIRYNNEERPAMRNRIYNDHIAAAFDKLCENIIHTLNNDLLVKSTKMETNELKYIKELNTLKSELETKNITNWFWYLGFFK